ncbi:DsrE family protein [Bradyrhizobium cenepequi]
MHRRSILWGIVSALVSVLVSVLGGALAASRARAASEAPSPTGKLKVAYHLSDIEKVNFVLGNIQNHLDGVGGPENVTIALVIHGPALRAFHSASANADLSRRVQQFSRDGVELAACGKTMKSQNVSLTELLPGFVVADKGGVVRLAELQSRGYLYLRP